ncbi:MAG: hypothetical protein AAFU73_00040 [Planctomycetota bacterium]
MKKDDRIGGPEERWPRGDALDQLLGLDEVDAPPGLAQRALDAARRADAPAVEPRPARRLRLVRTVLPAAALAAAAALLFVLAPRSSGPGGDADGGVPDVDRAPSGGGPRGASDPLVADADPGGRALLDAPSAELLASLPELEAYDFLVEDLDPLEADALFLLDAADPLVLDLLQEDS